MKFCLYIERAAWAAFDWAEGKGERRKMFSYKKSHQRQPLMRLHLVQPLDKTRFLMSATGWEPQRPCGSEAGQDTDEFYHAFIPIAAFLSDLTEHWFFLKEYVDLI